MPHLVKEIQGEVYPPPLPNRILSSILSLAFYLGLILIFLLPNLMPRIPVNNRFQPFLTRLNETIAANHGMIVMILFGSQLLAGQLAQSGAFEVFYDNQLIFSKLESNQLPNVEFLIRQLQQAAAS